MRLLWLLYAVGAMAHHCPVAAPSCELPPVCRSFAQIMFSNGSSPIIVDAPPYPQFLVLQPTGFDNRTNTSNFCDVYPFENGFLFTRDGNYSIDPSAVLYNNVSCSISCTTSCTNDCSATSCSTTCVNDCVECTSECATTCTPVCVPTCSTDCFADCPTPMFNVFAILDNMFTAADRNIAGASNSVPPNGVVTFSKPAVMSIRKGQRLTVMIQNGVSNLPVSVPLFAWSLTATRVD